MKNKVLPSFSFAFGSESTVQLVFASRVESFSRKKEKKRSDNRVWDIPMEIAASRIQGSTESSNDLKPAINSWDYFICSSILLPKWLGKRSASAPREGPARDEGSLAGYHLEASLSSSPS